MSSPVPIFGLENLHDDDSQVMDDLYSQTNTPPPIAEAIQPITIPGKPELPITSRILAGTESITTTTTAYRLLPADANRTEFQCVMTVPTGTAGVDDYLLVSDESGKVTNGSTQGAFRVRPGVGWDLDSHTGEIWIAGGPARLLAMELTWRAVTK